jgi:hypothetical protein
MTVAQFQKLSKIYELDLPEEDKARMYVKSLANLTDGQINTMHVKKFNKICAKVQRAFEVKGYDLQNGKPRKYFMIGGKVYRFNYDLKRPPNNAARYMEVATYSNDIIGNLHLILASMVTPIKWFRAVVPKAWQHEHIANDMKKLDFAVAYHAAVFFLESFQEINEVFASLFNVGNHSEDDEGEGKPDPTGFTSNFGWIYNAKMVSEFEGISVDDATDLPVLQFLNDLNYIKTKRAFDEYQYRQSTS